MRKRLLCVLSIALILVLAACSSGVDKKTSVSYGRKAQEIVQLLNEENFTGVINKFNEQMKGSLTEDELKTISPTKKSGKFIEYGKESVKEKDGIFTVTLVVKYEKEDRIYTISYDKDKKVAGLFIK